MFVIFGIMTHNGWESHYFSQKRFEDFMRFLEEHTLKQLKALDLLMPGDMLVVAVSAGSDSVALLHLLAALIAELEIRLCAVYVDHGLRPAEAVAETKLVEKIAAQLGASFRTGAVQARKYSDEHGVSLEAAARQLRYDFLEQVADELSAAGIAVAHTADDQAEEVLLRLIRGSGRNGLAGMSAVNYRRIIRPLLQIPKAQLLDYLDHRNIPFLEDSSNAERNFLRNRVRLDLLPYLEENFNPAIRQTLLRTANILRGEEELLDKLAGDLYRQAISVDGINETLQADTKTVLTSHPALARRVVEQILIALGSKPSFQHIDKLLELASRGDNGNELHLPKGLRVVKKDTILEFSYPLGRNHHRASLAASKKLSFEKILEGPGNWPIKELGITLKVEITRQQPDSNELVKTDGDYLDMTELEFPLIVRSIQPGDRFHPLGSPGSRKVADFLSDCKVSREKRCQVPILTNNDNIIALIGLRIDHRYRLVDNTKKVLKISLLSI